MRSRALIVVAALGTGLAACSDDSDERADPATGGLIQRQYTVAVNVARHEVENQDAEVTSATAVVRHNAGPNAPSNTGHRCTGEQILKIRLIGSFPHSVTTGTPGGGSTSVTEMDIEADPDSGEACLIGVGTSPDPAPVTGATVLQLDG